MAIIGYRTPTSAEIEAARVAAGIPSTALQYVTDNGQVVFYNLLTITQYYPNFIFLNATDKSNLLRSKIAGVYLVMPLVPIYQDPNTGLPTDTNPSIPVTQPSVPTAPTVDPYTLSLAGFIKFSKQAIDRQYIKDSMRALDADSFQVSNISTNTTVNVQLNGTAGVSYTPASFAINPGQTVDVAVSFNTTEINKLPEGMSTISTLVNLRAVDIVQPPSVPTPPPVVQTPPPNVGTGTWLEERFNGSPKSRSDAQIFAAAPFATQNVDSINYGRTNITREQTIRWTGALQFEAATYTFSATVDDGIKIFVDGQVILDQWKDQTDASYTVRKTMTAGAHTVVIWYYNGFSTGRVNVAIQKETTVIAAPTSPQINPIPVTSPTLDVVSSTPTAFMSSGGGGGGITEDSSAESQVSFASRFTSLVRSIFGQ